MSTLRTIPTTRGVIARHTLTPHRMIVIIQSQEKTPLMARKTSSNHNSARNLWKMDVVPMTRSVNLPTVSTNYVKTIGSTPSTRPNSVVVSVTSSSVCTEIDVISSTSKENGLINPNSKKERSRWN